MLIELLFALIRQIIEALTSWLPPATTLPWGIDSILITGFQGFRSLTEVFPPLSIVLNAFLLYLTFRVAMILIRLVFGHRAPQIHD